MAVQQRLASVDESLIDYIARYLDERGMTVRQGFDWTGTVDSLVASFPERFFNPQAARDMWCRDQVVQRLHALGYRVVAAGARKGAVGEDGSKAGMGWLQLSFPFYVRFEAHNWKRSQDDRKAIAERVDVWCKEHSDLAQTPELVMRRIQRQSKELDRPIATNE